MSGREHTAPDRTAQGVVAQPAIAREGDPEDGLCQAPHAADWDLFDLASLFDR